MRAGMSPAPAQERRRRMNRGIVGLAAMALLAPLSAGAQQPATPGGMASAHRTVSVSGTATVRKAPDQAVISLAVETNAPTAQDAAQRNAQRMAAVVRAVRSAGIPAERIRTTGYNLNPEYRYTNPAPGQTGEQKLVGYRATNTLEVLVDSIPRVGPVLDAAVAAGANRANGISYQLREPEAARREALRLAVANARQDAEALAAAAGVPLGELLELSSTGMVRTPGPVFARADMALAGAATPTPVEPGQLEITAAVSAVYRLGLPPQ
jgi:uncharacterized protein YggE